MKRRRVVQLAAIVAIAAVAFAVLLTGMGRELPVNPEHLDYLNATLQPDGTLILDGAWDGFSPNVLNRAVHLTPTAGGRGLEVWLFSKRFRNDQGDQTRIFRVRFAPGTSPPTATSLLVHGPDGTTRSVPIVPAPPSSSGLGVDPLNDLRAVIDSRPR